MWSNLKYSANRRALLLGFITTFRPPKHPQCVTGPKRGMWCARAINTSQGSTYCNGSELIQSFWSLSVKAWRDKSTFLSRSLISASIRFPSLSNLGGCWNAWTHSSGLLMKWRSKKTPTWRRWYCDLPPPKPPPALTIAAGLSAQQFFPLEAQSSAFFRGAAIVTQTM